MLLQRLETPVVLALVNVKLALGDKAPLVTHDEVPQLFDLRLKNPDVRVLTQNAGADKNDPDCDQTDHYRLRVPLHDRSPLCFAVLDHVFQQLSEIFIPFRHSPPTW